MEIWQAAAVLEYRPAPAPGTSYSAGGLDPYILARAKAGEALQIGHAVVPPKGSGTLPKFRPSSYVPPEDRELTDGPVSP